MIANVHPPAVDSNKANSYFHESSKIKMPLAAALDRSTRTAALSLRLPPPDEEEEDMLDLAFGLTDA